MLIRIFLLFVLFGLLVGCSQDKSEKPRTTPEASKAAHPALNKAQPPGFSEKAGRVFDRVNSVLTGYRAYRGQAPQSLADLDQGDYMFDSQYLADVVPADGQLYLELSPELDGSRLWFEVAGESHIASRSLAGSQVETLSRAELEKMKSGWQKVATVGRLTQVQR